MDEYEKILSTNSVLFPNNELFPIFTSITDNQLRVIFEEYFKKSKGGSTVIYHVDHLKTMKKHEKSTGIFEVQAGGYIKVKRKNVSIYLPQSTIYTNVLKNFIGACTCGHDSPIFDLTLQKNQGHLGQLRKDYFDFNQSKFYRFTKVKNDRMPNYYWFDNFCFNISVGFPISKKIYFEGEQKNEKFFRYSYASQNEKIEDFSSNDKKELNKNIIEVEELVKTAQKVEKNGRNCGGGVFPA